MHWEILLENIVRDTRLAIRSLRRDRRSSLLAIAGLALGIGASTVIFSLFYGVLLNPFPYKDSGRLVTFAIENLTNHGASTGRNWFSWQEFLTFREQNHIFEDLGAYHDGLVSMVLRDGNGPRLYPAAHVTASTFDFLWRAPASGTGDHTPGWNARGFAGICDEFQNVANRIRRLSRRSGQNICSRWQAEDARRHHAADIQHLQSQCLDADGSGFRVRH
jgi:hypothetical protein